MADAMADRLTLDRVAPLLRGVVRAHLATGRRPDLADIALRAGRPEHVRRRLPTISTLTGHGAVAATVELVPTRAKLEGCPCAVCLHALAELDGIPEGHVRVFLDDADGTRAVDLPRAWFDTEMVRGM